MQREYWKEPVTHHQIHTELQGKKTVEEPHIFTEAVQDSSNGVGVKEQDGCSQDGGKHAVVQNS